MSFDPREPSQNRLLAALPVEDYQRLGSHLEYVELSNAQVVCEAGEPIEYVYFPLNSVVSLVTTMADGSILDAKYTFLKSSFIPKCVQNSDAKCIDETCAFSLLILTKADI